MIIKKAQVILCFIAVFACNSSTLYRVEINKLFSYYLYIKCADSGNYLILFQKLKGQTVKVLDDTLLLKDDSTCIGKTSKIIKRNNYFFVVHKSKFLDCKTNVVSCDCFNLLNEDFNRSFLYKSRSLILDSIWVLKGDKFNAELYYDSLLYQSRLFSNLSILPDIFKERYNHFLDTMFVSVL